MKKEIMEGFMRNKIPFAACLLAFCAGLVPARAQNSEPQAAPAKASATQAAAAALPTVDQIIDKYVEASGGKAAFEKFTSQVSKGTFELDQDARRSYSGDKVLFVTTSPSCGVVQRGYNGTAGWG